MPWQFFVAASACDPATIPKSPTRRIQSRRPSPTDPSTNGYLIGHPDRCTTTTESIPSLATRLNRGFLSEPLHSDSSAAPQRSSDATNGVRPRVTYSGAITDYVFATRSLGTGYYHIAHNEPAKVLGLDAIRVPSFTLSPAPYIAISMSKIEGAILFGTCFPCTALKQFLMSCVLTSRWVFPVAYVQA